MSANSTRQEMLLTKSKEHLAKKEVLETFEDSGVLNAFNNLTEDDRNEMIGKITS
jgi:hypothetical protein